ncbi:hypothetical protein [Actinomadura sp. KC345]|uniref:hypothetical protein n=1 Tax=Actinomadura sp. KC345 TaxID=2530371 RepID=UPI001A9DF5CD|nr:hypothetical protein [Actinomadura sp. KC345]
MPNLDHLREFAGLRTFDLPSRELLATRLQRAGLEAEERGRARPDALPPDEAFIAAKAGPGAVAWRLQLMPFGDEEDFRTYLTRFIVASDLPMLEHLELYLGSGDGDGAFPEDLAPLAAGSAVPALTSLGLRNGQDTDALVGMLADAPVTRRLSVLDLSLGTLTDKGAQILLDAPAFRGLDRLDLHHHYMTEEMTELVRRRCTETGTAVDVSGRQEPEEYEEPDEDGYEAPWCEPAILHP